MSFIFKMLKLQLAFYSLGFFVTHILELRLYDPLSQGSLNEEVRKRLGNNETDVISWTGRTERNSA